MRRSERLHALFETLRRAGARGVTAERLAREFEVSVRTVKRDLDALESSGAAIWSRPGPGGGYGLANSGSLPPVTLSPAQAMALMAAVSAAPMLPTLILLQLAFARFSASSIPGPAGKPTSSPIAFGSTRGRRPHASSSRLWRRRWLSSA